MTSELAVWAVVIIAGAFSATAAAVGIYIVLAPKIGAIAYPTERGSHQAPTATGAGLPILIVSALFLTASHIVFGLGPNIVAYLLCAAVITLLGFVDDLKPLPVLVRLFIQIVAVVSLIAFTGPIPVLPHVHSFINLIANSVLIVVFINVFNFMDGSDGMVGLHAFVAMIGWVFVGHLRNDTSLVFTGFILAAVFAGFLVFNWHPAKVFLGDAGSTLVGFLLAAIPLTGSLGESEAADRDVLVVILFSWIFLFDTIFNRLVRLFGKIRFWEPNRDHFYQRLVDAGVYQATVAGLYGGITVLMTFATVGAFFFNGIFTSILVAASIGSPILLCIAKVKKEFDLNT